MPSIDVYGYIGKELEVDWHIKIHVIFAIVDAKQTRLAWYFYAQDMPARWQRHFDSISAGAGKLDRDEVFGEAIPYPTLNDVAGADITKLAARVPSIGTPATFEVRDQKDKTSMCELHKWLDLQSRPVSLQFDLTTAGERRSFNIPKTGHVWFLGGERFSKHALKRGIRGASPLTAGFDPYDPVF